MFGFAPPQQFLSVCSKPLLTLSAEPPGVSKMWGLTRLHVDSLAGGERDLLPTLITCSHPFPSTPTGLTGSHLLSPGLMCSHMASPTSTCLHLLTCLQVSSGDLPALTRYHLFSPAFPWPHLLTCGLSGAYLLKHGLICSHRLPFVLSLTCFHLGSSAFTYSCLLSLPLT